MTGRYKAYPEYKDSGIDWVGDIPSSWCVKPTYSVFDPSVTKNSDGQETTVLSLSYGRIIVRDVEANFGLLPESFNTYQIVNDGDLILRLTDLQNDKKSLRVGLVKQTGIITSAYLKLRSSEFTEPRFAYRLLHSYDTTKVFYGMGGGLRQSMKFEDFRRLPIIVPPFEEQQRIANFLDHETAKIDTLITKQEKLIELLKEKRQAVISHAVTKGLNPDAPMKDSGVEWLGEVPEHWGVMKFSYVIDFLEGPGILAVDFHDEGIPLLRIQNVKEAFVTDNFKTYLDPAKVKEKWDHFRVENGDLLISASASTGLISEVDERTVGAIPYTGLIRLKPMTKDITTDFIRYIVQSDLFYEQIKLLQTGSTIQHFGPIHLQQMKVLLPPVNEQNSIVEEIKQSIRHIDILVENAEKIIDLTKERKTALISAAVTGKIDVRDFVLAKSEASQ
ncbi:restriction endonuclease subunit S [Vibrio jasicida]|uniref:restriction endonuclease subunit S n=1 Tax=Vibrio jasicida TaxID=766224 RepID=UPI0005EF40B8|nr:restriction endonuclease subunit S [Vibrio jasicida]